MVFDHTVFFKSTHSSPELAQLSHDYTVVSPLCPNVNLVAQTAKPPAMCTVNLSFRSVDLEQIEREIGSVLDSQS